MSENKVEEIGDKSINVLLTPYNGTALNSQVAQKAGNYFQAHYGDELESEERSALKRVIGISTELEDVTEVEYRQLRLEKVVLVGIWSRGDSYEAEVSLRELAALADTAGAVVLDGLLQKRATIDPATYIGSGKARELRDLVQACGADTVIVDDELQPSQRRALEDVVKVKVIDRTALILDIFAQHAKSREGKAQVELAQLEYLLPRLRGWGASISRQAGGRAAGGEGIGSRGPGETKIELDRRRIRTRMAKLRKQIKAMQPARETKRAKRRRNHIPSVAFVGYTNAGKSSIINQLTGANVLVQNLLFATLDPTVRQAQTSDGRVYTLVDTVGFVRRLPTQLVEAFRSTLEEAAQADLILHVVDAAHADPVGQVTAVREILRDVPGVSAIPELVVLNKVDAVDEVTLAALRSQLGKVALVSAVTGEGLLELSQLIADMLPHPEIVMAGVVPFARGEVVSRLHNEAEILEQSFQAEGTYLKVRVDETLVGIISEIGMVQLDGISLTEGA